MKTKNPNALNKTADSAMSRSKLATWLDSCGGGYSLSRLIKLTKTIVLSFVGLALVTAGLSIVGITATAKKGETQPQSANTLTLAKASNNSSVNKITLIKAGTGLDGEGGSNNTVLINNSAKWRIALNLSTGTTTVTMEFPNGNVIDGASISSAAGCVDGSKVEKINGSYTNNKATCVIKADSPKSQNWDITDYVFGGNGQKLAPTKVTINGQNYTGTIPAVTLKGKANYRVDNHSMVSGGGTSYDDANASINGVNKGITIGLNVYSPIDDHGTIGLNPVSDGSIKFRIDMRKFPKNWSVDHVSIYTWANITTNCHNNTCRTLHNGDFSYKKSADGNYLDITINNVAMGYKQYPTQDTMGNRIDNRAYWSTWSIHFNIPTSSLTEDSKRYSIDFPDFQTTADSGEQTTVNFDNSSLWWNIANKNFGRSVIGYGVLGISGSFQSGSPVYSGEQYKYYSKLTNNIYNGDRVSNFNICQTWNPKLATLASEINLGNEWDSDANRLSFFNNVKPQIEYGVVNSDGYPDPKTACGKVGDGKVNFFATLKAARDYATASGGAVNAMRLHSDVLMASTDGDRVVFWGVMAATSLGVDVGKNIAIKTYATSDLWQSSGGNYVTIVPGKVHPELKFSNDSSTDSNARPNKTEHLTITPYAYAADTNVKAIVTLPADISPVGGSYKYNGSKLTPTSVVKNTDGTTTITLPLGTVGSKDAVNAKQPDITMDTVVSPTIATPASKTITVAMSGDGTDKMQYGWRSRSATFSVSNIIVNYGYNMSQSSADLLPGDTQTYNYTTYNNPDNPSANPSMKTISVLPYNGDNRGTTNVAYTPDKLTLNTTKDSSGVETDTNNLKLFYTTDQSIRENTRETDATVNWTEIPVSSAKVVTLAGTINPDGTTATEGKGYDLPKDVTAIKWVDTSTTKGRLVSVSLTLRDISSTGDNAKLASNIALVKVSNGSNTADQYELQDQETKIATVEPTTVSLAIDSQSLNLSHQVTADGADFAKTTSVLTTKTNNAYGYNLTMQAVKSNSLINQTSNSHQINSVAIGGGQAVATLASGTWGYALPGNTTQGFGDVNSYSTLTKTSKFKSIPGSTAAVLNVTRTRPNQITGDQTSVLYGANLTGRASGVYRADIVYTAVANPFK